MAVYKSHGPSKVARSCRTKARTTFSALLTHPSKSGNPVATYEPTNQIPPVVVDESDWG